MNSHFDVMLLFSSSTVISGCSHVEVSSAMVNWMQEDAITMKRSSRHCITEDIVAIIDQYIICEL